MFHGFRSCYFWILPASGSCANASFIRVICDAPIRIKAQNWVAAEEHGESRHDGFVDLLMAIHFQFASSNPLTPRDLVMARLRGGLRAMSALRDAQTAGRHQQRFLIKMRCMAIVIVTVGGNRNGNHNI